MTLARRGETQAVAYAGFFSSSRKAVFFLYSWMQAVMPPAPTLEKVAEWGGGGEEGRGDSDTFFLP